MLLVLNGWDFGDMFLTDNFLDQTGDPWSIIHFWLRLLVDGNKRENFSWFLVHTNWSLRKWWVGKTLKFI